MPADSPARFLSVQISSITTGGGLSLVLILDWTATTPRIVGNQIRPSLPFQPAGLATPLHWMLTSPSAFPKGVVWTNLIVPRSRSSKSFLLTRKIPVRQLIQK